MYGEEVPAEVELSFFFKKKCHVFTGLMVSLR